MKKRLLLTAVLFTSAIWGFSLNNNLTSSMLPLEASSYDSISLDYYVGNVVTDHPENSDCFAFLLQMIIGQRDSSNTLTSNPYP